ncbi:hypothetical protein SAMN04488561_4633 [Jiangella alba]|uniref:Uncharacterized protein n=2 Tax=Jiangella alba TaxID=561176 RepID=A0A1H5PMS9_9ACTN|nr:hypothetical protein SAMN04488561_4633 [Jiangella alba]
MQMGSYSDSVRALQNIIKPVFDALTKGLEAAAQQHLDSGFARGDDPHYFSHTARRVASKELGNLGITATNESSGRPLLSLSGILITHNGLAVRVLRSPYKEGTRSHLIPPPGRSARRQAFWRQMPALSDFHTDNHLLLWTDDESRLLDPMTLVRPLGGDYRRDSVIVDWAGPLSRGMSMLRAADLDELRPSYKSDQLEG